VNGNSSPPSDKHAADKAAAARLNQAKRHHAFTALGVACLIVGVLVILAHRHRNGSSPTRPSTPTPSAPSPLESTEPDFASVDAGDRTPSLDEIQTLALAWKPPVASGVPSGGDRNAALAVNLDDHCLGSHEARVTLMLFGDLECPFTLHMVRLLQGWLDERPKSIRLVWRERPLDIHPGARTAALTAERLALRFGENAFWRFIFALAQLERAPTEAELLALEMGLRERRARVTEAVATTQAAVKLERDRLVALTYAVHETPTIYVNGLRLEGEVSRIHLEQLVGEEQEEVESLVDDSVPQGRLYTLRVDTNLLDWDRE